MVIKGTEIEAAILFADISGFSSRTAELSPAATLIFANHFFTWITSEALKGSPCIIDKYIGDEVMVVFSEEFGSNDSFVDAVQTARRIAEDDAWSFRPHIGIAKGPVIVGNVGTSLMQNCSVFGSTVSLASRCAGIRPPNGRYGSIVFPSHLWEGQSFDRVFPPRTIVFPDGQRQLEPVGWTMGSPVKEVLKGIGEVELACIEKTVGHYPSQSAEARAVETYERLRGKGRQ